MSRSGWWVECATTCFFLIHWGRVMHICISKFTIIGWDNGLSPSRHQAIIRTNAGIFLILPLETNFSETFIDIHMFHSRKCIWKCRLRNAGHCDARHCRFQYDWTTNMCGFAFKKLFQCIYYIAIAPYHTFYNASDILWHKCGHMCTFLLQKCSLWYMGLVHYSLYATAL